MLPLRVGTQYLDVTVPVFLPSNVCHWISNLEGQFPGSVNTILEKLQHQQGLSHLSLQNSNNCRQAEQCGIHLGVCSGGYSEMLVRNL